MQSFGVRPSVAVAAQGFEAEIFGAPVWRLDLDAGSDTAALAAVTQDARQNGVALVSARVSAGSPIGNVLAGAGFRRIERLLTLRRDIAGAPAPVAGVTMAGRGDAEACAAIGRASFSFDRFHADPRIADAVADEIKARWARSGVNGRADAPLIVREADTVAGFNLCMRRGEDAVIDLIAVDPRWRGRGFGRKLVEGAFAHYAGVAQTMWVSTQDTNTASLALYRSAGFAPHGAADTWHWTP